MAEGGGHAGGLRESAGAHVPRHKGRFYPTDVRSRFIHYPLSYIGQRRLKYSIPHLDKSARCYQHKNTQRGCLGPLFGASLGLTAH